VNFTKKCVWDIALPGPSSRKGRGREGKEGVGNSRIKGEKGEGREGREGVEREGKRMGGIRRGREGMGREGAEGEERIGKGNGGSTWIFVQGPRVLSYATDKCIEWD